MRKITSESVKAFLNGDRYSNSNMYVNRYSLYLHSNLIATKKEEDIYISNAGWCSNTTKERLNGLLSMLNKRGIFQKDFIWYYCNTNNEVVKFPYNKLLNVNEIGDR